MSLKTLIFEGSAVSLRFMWTVRQLGMGISHTRLCFTSALEPAQDFSCWGAFRNAQLQFCDLMCKSWCTGASDSCQPVTEAAPGHFIAMATDIHVWNSVLQFPPIAALPNPPDSCQTLRRGDDVAAVIATREGDKAKARLEKPFSFCTAPQVQRRNIL